MSFFRTVFDNVVEHDFRWASTLIKLALWWSAAFFGLILLFYSAYRMKGMVSAIPPVIQGACVILSVLTAWLMATMIRESRRALAAYDRFLAVFANLKPATERERAIGLSPEKMTEIRRAASPLRLKPREWWRALDDAMESYTSPGGDEGWFLTRTPAECLSEEDVVDSFYHSSFHQSVPSILTALGLLATFVAILMALAGVTYNALDPVRPVSGIDQLINGLSGKFLSSIIALILSVVFTFVEKKVCDRQLRNGYDQLIRRSREVFPYLSQARILLDIQRIAVNSQIGARAMAERS